MSARLTPRNIVAALLFVALLLLPRLRTFRQ